MRILHVTNWLLFSNYKKNDVTKSRFLILSGVAPVQPCIYIIFLVTKVFFTVEVIKQLVLKVLKQHTSVTDSVVVISQLPSTNWSSSKCAQITVQRHFCIPPSSKCKCTVAENRTQNLPLGSRTSHSH